MSARSQNERCASKTGRRPVLRPSRAGQPAANSQARQLGCQSHVLWSPCQNGSMSGRVRVATTILGYATISRPTAGLTRRLVGRARSPRLNNDIALDLTALRIVGCAARRCGVADRRWRLKAHGVAARREHPHRDSISQMKLLWKIQVDNEPRQMHSLFPVLVADGVETAEGTKEIALVTGVSDNLYGIDAKTGDLIWKKHFENTDQPQGPTQPHYTLCPGGIMATPVIGPGDAAGRFVVYAASWDGRLHRLNLADGGRLPRRRPSCPLTASPTPSTWWTTWSIPTPPKAAGKPEHGLCL